VHGFIDAVLRLASCQPAWRLPIPAVNVGNDRETEVLELARLVLQATGSSAPIRFRPYAEAFPGRSDLRSRKPNLRRLHALIGRPDWLPIEGIVSEVAGATRAMPEEAIAVA
jgi:UDP-glucose 4-epimerase